MAAASFPLLAAKLHRPLPAPSSVPRPRLLDRLGSWQDASLVLIAAAAGSGKTTLVVQWLEQVACPVAWLSLDETDDDLAGFLGYFVAAVHTVCPGACAGVERLLHALQPPPAAFLITALVNELGGVVQPFVLVLDDYHHLHQPAIHQLVDQVLRHAPPSLHLIITSRFDPPLALSRLAARGKLVEIRGADLRFRSAEAQALLERVSGLRLPGQSVDDLVDDFDGWAAGLQSAALSLRLGDLPAGARRRLAGILADEVFAMQPAAVCDFLLRTSLLSQLTPPLCQFLLAESGAAAQLDSQALLARLERDGLFIVALDEEHGWYRYHNLFRTFLSQRLEQTCSTGEIAALHRRASLWYWQQGSAHEAIRHATAAQDASLAADIVEAHLAGMLNREEWPILERWLSLFAAEVIQRRPRLLVAQAWVLFFQVKLSPIPQLLVQAESLLRAQSDPVAAYPEIRSDLETLRALMCLVAGDFGQAAASAQRALASAHADRAFSRGVAVFLLSLSLYALQGEAQAVAFCAKIADDPLEKVVVRARALESLCHIFGIACRPAEQGRAARILLKLAQEHALDVSIAWAHRHLGSSTYERNELAAAVEHFSQGVAQRYLAHFTCARDCFIGLALAHQAQGRADEAQAVAAALQAFYVERGLANLPEFDSFQARLALLQGDPDRALHTLERIQPTGSALSMRSLEMMALTQAMVHVLAGTAAQRRAAATALGELRLQAEASHSTWYLVRILALQAVALDLDGHAEAALDSLQQAVVLAQPGRIVMSFVELGPPMERLLRRLDARGVAPAYVRAVLAAFPRAVPGNRPGAPAHAPTLVEPLSAREMEVLVLLSRRLSNKEIAANLVVSPLTVKRHMTNILQKLGVRSRWEAVEQARALGLLSPFPTGA